MFKNKRWYMFFAVGLTILAFVIVIILYYFTHTNNKKYIYNGESNNWSASYKVDVSQITNDKNSKSKYSTNINSELNIFYKNYKKESDAMKIIEYRMKSSTRELSGTVNFPSRNKDGIVKITNSNKNILYESDDEEIKLTIKWNGKEEEIKLRKNVPN